MLDGGAAARRSAGMPILLRLGQWAMPAGVVALTGDIEWDAVRIYSSAEERLKVRAAIGVNAGERSRQRRAKEARVGRIGRSVGNRLRMLLIIQFPLGA